jgi:hypothetical protein
MSRVFLKPGSLASILSCSEYRNFEYGGIKNGLPVVNDEIYEFGQNISYGG